MLPGRDDSGESRMREICTSGSTRERGTAIIDAIVFRSVFSSLLYRFNRRRILRAPCVLPQVVILCAFCAFSWPTAFSGLAHGSRTACCCSGVRRLLVSQACASLEFWLRQRRYTVRSASRGRLSSVMAFAQFAAASGARCEAWIAKECLARSISGPFPCLPSHGFAATAH